MPFSVFIPCKYLSADFVISNAKFFHFSRKATQEDHQQLYCRSCQKVKSIHISDAQLKALIDACPDIVPEDYSLTVFGLCDECAAKAAQETEEL